MNVSLEQFHLDLLTALTPWAEWELKKTERFSALYDLLLETNARMNVTALTGKTAVTLKHFADSLTPLLIPSFAGTLKDGSVCDLGCGGGFPGLPLAIACPGARISMIDSTEKKLRSVRENADKLGLAGINTLCGRGEDLAKAGSGYRESFDAVVSRAVAPLPQLVELCLPLVKPGGVFVAMKGMKGEEELEASKRGAGKLGSAKPELIPLSFPDVDLSFVPEKEREEVREYLASERFIVLFQKERPTPLSFPRSWAQMKRKPL